MPLVEHDDVIETLLAKGPNYPFRDSIRQRRPLKRFPTLDERLEQVGQGRNYVLYKTACQFVHPTTRALAMVRDLHATHGTDSAFASYHYRTTARDWVAAILLGAEALGFGLETVSGRLQRPGQPLSQEMAALFNTVVARTQAMTLTPA